MLPVTTITTAVTAALSGTSTIRNVRSLALQATFTYGSGGTSAKAWVQTSLDGGTTWFDIASFAFTTSSATRIYNLDTAAVTTIYTPTDATITDNTAKSGILGDKFRVKYTTTGTYAGGTTLRIDAVATR